MVKYIEDPLFKIISDIGFEKGVEVYVIGGYVRDCILGRESKDIDIVAVGKGIEIAKEFAKRVKSNKISVFKNFGTAMVRFRMMEIEFVGARKESYQRNSRKPIVEDGTLKDDQDRRDFTINALAISLNRETYGEIVDPFNGQNDIKKQIIRTPLDPDITYSDDPLRMIRAIRFATQLDFEIHKDSLNAISKNRDRINIVSKERINDELNKIISADKPSTGFILLEKTGLLEIIFPEFHNLKGIDVIKGKKHKDVFYHTLQVLDNLTETSDNLWLRWAALLHDIGKPSTKKFIPELGWTFHGHDFIGAKMIPDIFKKMKMPLNEKMKFIQKIVQLHLRPIVLSQEVVTDSAIRRLLYDAGDDIDSLMMLCEADITSKNQEKVTKYLKNFKKVRKKLKDVEERDKIRNWQPPISGEIVMKTFGIKPCKEVGVIKNSIKEAILDGIIRNDYDEAFEFMLKKGEELGLIKVDG
jgi:poly(A) polymerase